MDSTEAGEETRDYAYGKSFTLLARPAIFKDLGAEAEEDKKQRGSS